MIGSEQLSLAGKSKAINDIIPHPRLPVTLHESDEMSFTRQAGLVLPPWKVEVSAREISAFLGQNHEYFRGLGRIKYAGLTR